MTGWQLRGWLFNFKDAEVRLVMIEGNPWFVAKDVCAALGLNFYNKSCAHHLVKLGAEEKQTTSRSEVEVGRYGLITLVSESGLYKLVMRSDKPEAKFFQDWVTKDVLPAIRKDGAYIKGEEKPSFTNYHKWVSPKAVNFASPNEPERVVKACGKKKNPAVLKSLKDKEKRGLYDAGGEGGIRTHGTLQYA